jgi:hypothetical protein
VSNNTPDGADVLGVRVRVLETSALSHSADVLILKYAQALHGLDAQVAELLSVDARSLPAVGSYQLIEQPSSIAARNVLFLGVPPLRAFGYREIREFASRGVQVALQSCRGARELMLTLHGAGYGLDETEAFESELGGVLDGLQSEALWGRVRGEVRTVTFAESSASRAARMRETLAQILSGENVSAHAPYAAGSVREGAADRLRSVGYDSPSRPHALVAMPFDEAFEDHFFFGISQPIREAGLLCERADREAFVGDILQWLKDRIRTAAFVVADLTDANPNVYLEVGYAWGCDKPTILVCQKQSPLLFDVRGQKVNRYGSIKELHDVLRNSIKLFL